MCHGMRKRKRCTHKRSENARTRACRMRVAAAAATRESYIEHNYVKPSHLACDVRIAQRAESARANDVE